MRNNIVQTKNPKTGRYVKLDLDKGIVLGHKKSEGPYKNIPIIKRERKNVKSRY